MTLLPGLRRALSASLLVRDAGGVLDNDALLASQPEGDLRAFLSRTYADHEAVEVAFCDAGGSIIARTADAGAAAVDAVAFDVDGQGRPTLRITGAGTGTLLALRLAIPHSSVG
jgi:hypothetical protein